MRRTENPSVFLWAKFSRKLNAMRKRMKSPILLTIVDHFLNFPVEMGDELGMMVCKPFSERARQVKKLGFIKERELHAGIAIKSADVDLDGASFKNAAVSSDVGVFVAVALFAAEDDQVDDGGDGLFSSFDVLRVH